MSHQQARLRRKLQGRRLASLPTPAPVPTPSPRGTPTPPKQERKVGTVSRLEKGIRLLEKQTIGRVSKFIGIGPIVKVCEDLTSPKQFSELRQPPATLRPLSTQGFSTPHLQKAQQTGSEKRAKEAREKMRRLGRRLRGRIDF